MYFPKNKTLAQKEKAYKSAVDELEDHKAATPALKRAVVLAESGVGDLPDAVMALSENARAIESTEARLGMCRSDLYAHLENDIQAAKDRLPVDEAELAATHQGLESELIEKMSRCEAIAAVMGYEWLPVAEKFRGLRADELRHPLRFKSQTFEDIADFQQEATRISRLQKADAVTLVRNAYISSTKRACGKGEPPPPVAKKQAAA